MQMFYDSDNYTVVQFELGPEAEPQAARGGYEIVDKFARKEIYLDGALAESFKQGVEALIESTPTAEAIDAYIERYAALMQQKLVLH